MEWQPAQTFKRNPFEILAECFNIYGRHFRKLILIALIVQVPLAGLEFTLADSLLTLEDFPSLQASLGGEVQTATSETAEPLENPREVADPLTRDEIIALAIPTTGYFIAAIILQTFAAGTIAVAVGMQYAAGAIETGFCYRRAWWRVLTLISLGLISFGLIVLMTAGLAILIIPGLVVLVLAIFWSVATPAAVIEGVKPISSLRRSYELVRRNWWRTCATWVLTLLVVIGLTILLTLLLAAPLTLLGNNELSSGITRIANTLMGMLSNAIIAPILGVAGTLIYFDLRSRKEEFDIASLSEQIGMSPPNGRLT